MRIKNLLILLSVLVLFSLTGYAKEAPGQPKAPAIAKTSGQNTVLTISNISRWEYWTRRDGQSAHTPDGNSGGIYPGGTAATIYQDGVVWGGYINNDTRNPDAPKLRVGGQTYSIGTTPGHVISSGTATADPVAVPADDAFIYRIRQDWRDLAIGDAALISDAASVNEVSAGSVTDEMQQALLDEYAWAWNNWPAELGAPVDDNGDPGIANADQVIWFVVNDLEPGAADIYGSPPIGLELQVTLWAYDQPGATLGQTIFKRYRFRNVSGFTIDSMFVSQWSDPDVGIFTDDLVGNDRSRSLGFAYSGFLTDGDFDAFNIPPAAAGYDFFQGPLVDGVAGQDLNGNGIDDAEDSGLFDFQLVPGKINLPMTSFGYFAAGTSISDPTLDDYEGTLQWYNLLNGFLPTTDSPPVPYTAEFGDNKGEDTKFPLDGDPVARTGDIDGFFIPPADRRMVLATGPITLAPDETQEFVVGLVGGIITQTGGNNRNAVAQLKLNDDLAQFVFNARFEAIPTPPPAPDAKFSATEDAIFLEWGSNTTRAAATEADDPLLGFNFEGYNVYQLPDANAGLDQATKIATFDLNNTIDQVRQLKFLPEFGDLVSVPIQQGLNTGIQRFIKIEQDFINERPLFAGNEYYFAVTAYNAKDLDGNGIVDNDVPEASLESAANVIAVTPQAADPSVQLDGVAGDQLEITHNGSANAIVEATIINPSLLVDATYVVSFSSDTTATSDTTFTVSNSWNLSQNGSLIVEKNTDLSNLGSDINSEAFNGVRLKLGDYGFEAGTTYLSESIVANGANLGLWGDGTLFGNSTGFFAEFGNGVKWPAPASLAQWDLEFRFTGNTADGLSDNDAVVTEGGQWTTQWERGAFGNPDLSTMQRVNVRAPFELWDVENNIQIQFAIINRNADGASPYGNDVGTAADARYRMSGRDYIVVIYKPYEGDASATYSINDPNSTWLLFFLQGGASVWENGDVQSVQYANPIIAGSDTYTFSTQAPVTVGNDEVAESVENIGVFPNPYYAYNPSETSRFSRFVTFTHLPKSVTVRLFSLSGQLVRTLTEADKQGGDNQFMRWDLRNEAGLPVASGMYIAHIELPDLNREKVLKLFIVQGEEFLEYY